MRAESKIIDVDSKDLRIFLEIGFFLAESGRMEEALTVFKGINEMIGFCEPAWIGLGNTYTLLKNLDEARKCYQEILNANTQNPLAHALLGELLLLGGKIDEGLDHIEVAKRIDPSGYAGQLSRYLNALEKSRFFEKHQLRKEN